MEMSNINQIHQSILKNIKEKTPRFKTYEKNYILKKLSKTISAPKKSPPTSRLIKQIPVLNFPLSLRNNTQNSSLSPSYIFLSSKRTNRPLTKRKQRTLNSLFLDTNNFRNSSKTYSINNYFDKKIFHSRFNKPVMIGKTIEKKIKESKKSKKLKRLNVLDFGNNLKIYDQIEKKYKNKIIVERRKKELDDIYYDYDKKNRKFIMNSFSGNSSNLLKNKILFVKGVMDYLYPKMVLKRVDILNEIKQKKFNDELKNLQENQKGKIFSLKHKTYEQNASMSKYLYGGELEIIRPKDNLIKSKRVLINKTMVSKLLNDYDFV